MDGDGYMTVIDRTRRVASAAWPFVASLAAVAVIVQATIISVGAIRDRDRLAIVASHAAAAARDAKNASDLAAARAAEAAPCNPGDPVDKPACKRKAEADAYVAGIIGQMVSAIEAHDAAANVDHVRLQSSPGVRSALPPRTPITITPRPTTAPRPAAVTPTTAPATTTTTCPRRPNGKCRP